MANRSGIEAKNVGWTAALMTAVAIGGCGGSVSLARTDLERLRTSSEIPVVYQISSNPWIDCNSDLPDAIWTGPGSALEPSPRPLMLASEGGEAADILKVATSSGEAWENFELQRTAALRAAPPTDPTRATVARFLLLAHQPPEPLPLRGDALSVKSVDPEALSGRFGPVPVLVFETTRWVLAGCWYTYQPWFNVRATLLDLRSGKVLWRHACGGLFPPDSSQEASPSELEANGKALYARLTKDRAERCAEELFSGLEDGAQRVAGWHSVP
jgi:hypothetical protein